MTVWPAVLLSLKLASVTTVILLALALPTAWWLATTRSRARPFAVQPLQTGFAAVGVLLLEAAATLGARPYDAFRSVALPMARGGLVTASVLSFAHTLGEFGVVLMVGGNIPGQTRVISIEIFSAVETLDYASAHQLSAGLMMFSFVVLLLVYRFNRRGARTLG